MIVDPAFPSQIRRVNGCLVSFKSATLKKHFASFLPYNSSCFSSFFFGQWLSWISDHTAQGRCLVSTWLFGFDCLVARLVWGGHPLDFMSCGKAILHSRRALLLNASLCHELGRHLNPKFSDLTCCAVLCCVSEQGTHAIYSALHNDAAALVGGMGQERTRFFSRWLLPFVVFIPTFDIWKSSKLHFRGCHFYLKVGRSKADPGWMNMLFCNILNDLDFQNEAIIHVQSAKVSQTDISVEDDEDVGKTSVSQTLQLRTSVSWPSSVNLELPVKKTPITEEVEKVEGLGSSQFCCCSLEWIQKQAREVSRRGFKPTKCITVTSYFCTCLVMPALFAIALGLSYSCTQGEYEYSWSLWAWFVVQAVACFVSLRVLVKADTLYQHLCLRMVLLFGFAGSIENIWVSSNCREGTQTFCTFLQGVPCQSMASMISCLYWSAVHLLIWMLMLRIIRLEEVMHARFCSILSMKVVLCCIPLGYVTTVFWAVWEFRSLMRNETASLLSLLLRSSLYFTAGMISIFATCMFFSVFFPITKLSLALWQGRVKWSSEARGALQSLLYHLIMGMVQLVSGFAILIGLWAYVTENGTALNWLLIPQMFDTLSNTIGMYFFSGATWARSEESLDSTDSTGTSSPRVGDCSKPVTNLTVETDAQWDACVEQLSSRGFCLGELLTFYQSLKDDMPHLNSNVHTTNDIVWQVIIPRTSSKGCSYSSLMTDGNLPPTMMVTHNWGNRFRDLCAAIVSDAFGQDEYSVVADLLDRDPKKLEDALEVDHQLKQTYWVCCFSVNQHRSICNFPFGPRPDPVTSEIPPVCTCKRQKYLNDTPPLDSRGRSCFCEMNKFDDMMFHIARSNPRHRHVVAVDSSFVVFERAWCVSEIYTGSSLGLHQHLIIRSRDDLQGHDLKLRNLRIENMQASRQEDVEEILRKIQNVDGFNAKFQELLFDPRDGLFSQVLRLDGMNQMERIGRFLRWVVWLNQSINPILFWSLLSAKIKGRAVACLQYYLELVR